MRGNDHHAMKLESCLESSEKNALNKFEALREQGLNALIFPLHNASASYIIIATL